MRKILLGPALLAAMALLGSCTAMRMGSYMGSSAVVATSGIAKGQFHVQFVECIGNASSQSVTAVVLVTNTGPSAKHFIGGASDGTLAIDSFGETSKPYSSSGKLYDLPSGVGVRVAIERIEPVRPGAVMFRTLRVSVGSGNRNSNIVELRNVPIVWSN